MPPLTYQLDQLEAACLSFQQEAAQGTKPRIAAWGLVKAGKSSLLNMLSGHVQDEVFKTGVIRTTTLNQELETEHFVLIDTPGLGIDKNDSHEAHNGLNNADVILFVHAPPGELDQEEMSLLAQLKASYAEHTEQRLILVLTQLDKDHDGAMAQIQQRVLAQLENDLNIKPKCFQVSNSRYRKGAAQGLAKMAKSSGIPDLVIHLKELSLSIKDQLDTVRSGRRTVRKAELLDQLEQAIAYEHKEISRLQKPYISKARAFNRTMAELKKSFDSYATQINDTQTQLNSL